MSASNLVSAAYLARRELRLYMATSRRAAPVPPASPRKASDGPSPTCASTCSTHTCSFDSLSDRSVLSSADGSVRSCGRGESSKLFGGGSSSVLGSNIQSCHAHAHWPSDVPLLSAFLELAGLEDVDPATVRLLLSAVKFLRLCDYAAEDICCILAHSSAYFVDISGECGSRMDSKEVGNVLVTLMFVAHSYVLDETCPLRVWHQHLFQSYCPLRTLSGAVVRVLEVRRYILRIADVELERRYKALRNATSAPMSSPSSRPRTLWTMQAEEGAGEPPLAQDLLAAPSSAAVSAPADPLGWWVARLRPQWAAAGASA